MRPIKERTDQFTNLSGRNREMAFDSSAMRFIMSTLTELYSDVEQAVIREYLTNAFDSHIEAGVETPVDISFDAMANKLTIEDYGVGLSEDELFNVYALYGSSTKRDSDDVAGMLGLGSKSALAYAESFTVQGTKDGKRTVVLISKNEAGVGEMSVVSSTKTDAPNGVKVVVPCRDNLDHKIRRTVSFLPSGKVRYNGELNKRTFNNDGDAIKLADGIHILSGYDYGNGSYVVMGNVAYPASFSFRAAIVVDVEVGLVEPTPSREALKGSAHTQRGMAEITRRVESAIEDYIESLKDSKSWDAIYSKAAVLNRVGRAHDLAVPVPDYSYNINGQTTGVAKSRDTVKSIYDLQRVNDSVLIKYELASAPSTVIRAKVAEYLAAKDIEVGHIMFYDPKRITGPLKYFPSKRVLDYEKTIKPIKLKSQQAKRSVAGTYKTYGIGLSDMQVVSEDDIDQYKLVYFSRTEDLWELARRVRMNAIANDYFTKEGYRFCLVGKNRWDKMNRLGGDDNIHLVDFIDLAIKENSPVIDEQEREEFIQGRTASYGSGHGAYNFFKKHVPSSQWPKEVKELSAMVSRYRKLRDSLDEKVLAVYNDTADDVDVTCVSRKFEIIIEDYPMLRMYNDWTHRNETKYWKDYVALVNSTKTP